MRQRYALVFIALAIGTSAALVYSTKGIQAQPVTGTPKKLPGDVLQPLDEITPPKLTAVNGTSTGMSLSQEAKKSTPFDRYRDYDALPELTREIVFSTQRGMEWLSRDGIHLPNGRFIAGLDPALGRVTDDDHLIRQAMGAMALARAAHLTGDEKYAVKAGHTILTLLGEMPLDTASGMRKSSLTPSQCNAIGAAAYTAVAIFELPSIAPEMRQAAEELIAFLRGQLKPDGSINVGEAGSVLETECLARYPGVVLLAIAKSQRTAPAAWKMEALAKAGTYYRKEFRATPDLALVPWMTSAFAEAYNIESQRPFAEFVFEMVDWTVKLQYGSGERQRAAWRGGFPRMIERKKSNLPTVESAYLAMGIAEACRMIRQMKLPDVARYEQYKGSLTRALRFLTTLQYGEENTQHFAAHFRPAIVGAFHPSSQDGSLRLDDSAAAVAALTQYLIAVADR